MRYNEIYRTLVEITDKDINKQVREQAFKINSKNRESYTKEEEQEMFRQQSLLINAFRQNMTPDGALPDLAKYKNKKTTVIPTGVEESTYILVFFDKEIDPDNMEMSSIKYDEDDNTFYIED